MVLREARCKFTVLFATKLIPKAIELGYEVAYDEITNHQGTGHRDGSLHYFGCAGDLIIYLNGVYYPQRIDLYQPLGDYWETLDPDCHWGGNFKDAKGNPVPDADHFSFAPVSLFGGMK